MKDKIYEQLSALVDDELADSEQSLLIRQIVRDPGLRARLLHYQIISDALHGNLPQQINTRFHERVCAAVQHEAAIDAAPSRFAALLTPLAGLAIAASVAVVAVVSLKTVRQQDTAATPSVATAPSVDSYIRAENAPTPVAPARGLDVYLVNHNEFAVNRSMQGMLPYVRIIGQDTQPEHYGKGE